MFKVRNYSISQKLTWMNMLVSGAALLSRALPSRPMSSRTFGPPWCATLHPGADRQARTAPPPCCSTTPQRPAPTYRRSTPRRTYGRPASTRRRGNCSPPGCRDPGDRLSAAAVPAGQEEFSRFTPDELIPRALAIMLQGQEDPAWSRSDLRRWARRLRARLVRYAGIVAVVLMMSLMAGAVFTIFQREYSWRGPSRKSG